MKFMTIDEMEEYMNQQSNFDYGIEFDKLVKDYTSYLSSLGSFENFKLNRGNCAGELSRSPFLNFLNSSFEVLDLRCGNPLYFRSDLSDSQKIAIMSGSTWGMIGKNLESIISDRLFDYISCEEAEYGKKLSEKAYFNIRKDYISSFDD